VTIKCRLALIRVLSTTVPGLAIDITATTKADGTRSAEAIVNAES
jgi:hypothetical protein